MTQSIQYQTGQALRSHVRDGHFSSQTAGQSPDFLQGNVVILPLKYAADFLQFCLNNPKPCPLIGVSEPGTTSIPTLADDLDLRRDVPRYRIYEGGKLVREAQDISELWRSDLVTFVLGCSFTFEEALIRQGYPVRHISQGSNVPMFRSNIETIPGGVFRGPVVVTMRPYKPADIPAVYDICARYPHAHGAPLYWGNPEMIGIKDLNSPDYGDAVQVEDDEIPVFWACGVTPQAAITAAKPDFCVTHAPGYMLVTDIPSSRQPELAADMTSFFNANSKLTINKGETL